MPRIPFRGGRAEARPLPDEETRAHVAGAASAAAADTSAAPAVEPDPGAAAFFDVDNTMMMGASLFWFARGLAARKYFTMRDLALIVDALEKTVTTIFHHRIDYPGFDFNPERTRRKTEPAPASAATAAAARPPGPRPA